MSASPDTGEAAPTLPATLRLGPVHLAVTDLDRSIGFYRDAIGLRQHHRGGAAAVMGAGAEDLLVLLEEPNARPAGRHAGLYHFALLHPSRLELARAAKRLIAGRVAISGASDHGISEAIYLPDPDGNASSWPPTARARSGATFATRRSSGRSRSTWRASWPSWPTRSRRRRQTRVSSSATFTCTWATSRRDSPSTATCSASSR